MWHLEKSTRAQTVLLIMGSVNTLNQIDVLKFKTNNFIQNTSSYKMFFSFHFFKSGDQPTII